MSRCPLALLPAKSASSLCSSVAQKRLTGFPHPSFSCPMKRTHSDIISPPCLDWVKELQTAGVVKEIAEKLGAKLNAYAQHPDPPPARSLIKHDHDKVELLSFVYVDLYRNDCQPLPSFKDYLALFLPEGYLDHVRIKFRYDTDFVEYETMPYAMYQFLVLVNPYPTHHHPVDINNEKKWRQRNHRFLIMAPGLEEPSEKRPTIREYEPFFKDAVVSMTHALRPGPVDSWWTVEEKKKPKSSIWAEAVWDLDGIDVDKGWSYFLKNRDCSQVKLQNILFGYDDE